METLRIYFNNFLQFDNQEWKDFENCLTKVKITNNERILKQGEHSKFIAFITEESFRFYYEKEGEEKITAFF